MDEKQLAKLIKKNVKAVEKARQRPPARAYDPTLTRKEVEETDVERDQFFDEMKRREF
ncbi:MAG TPA: hypothetical protein VNA89_14650 [Gemmatimonadaceae bacterium]|nr:hypothetical protein [Gemmatimonadaceae bacterium]